MTTMPAPSATPPVPALIAGLPFQQFTENSDDVFWLADLVSGQLLYTNPRFEQVWGVKVQDLLADPMQWNQAVAPADAHLLPSPFFADPRTSQCALREYRIRDAQGQTRWIRDRRFYLRNADNEVTQVGGIAEDVTERKLCEIEREALLQREQSARQAAEALTVSKDQFIAMVTHELRSPLNALRGWAHVLRRAGTLNPLQEKALEAMDRSTLTQARLVDDLLDSQRLLLGSFQLQWGHADLDVLVQEAAASVQGLALAKRIRLEVAEGGVPVGTISADAERLRQALVNLLSNAVKFTPDDGRVNVRLLRGEHTVAIEVEDSGIGLATAQLPTVFKRFEQADSSNTRRQSGLGLGLSLAQQVIELHGGQILVSSEGVGRGATFTIELPDKLLQPAPVSPAASSSHAVLAGKRVVIVEDDDDGREILELMLRDAQVELRSFDRAASAYEHLARLPDDQQPDLLISDIAMPDEDGYAFIHRVREMESRLHRPRLVALALTSFSRQEDRQRALAAGFDEHVGKPIDSHTVLNAMEAALGQRPTSMQQDLAPTLSP